MRYNKKIISIALTFLVAVCMSIISPHSASSKIITNVQPDISSDELRAIVIEDFEKGTIASSLEQDGWYMTTQPKKLEKESDDPKKKKNPILKLKLDFIDGGPNDLTVEKFSPNKLGETKAKCLAGLFQFRYPGNNSVHVQPPLEVDWKTREPIYVPGTAKERDRAIQLPGKSQGISLWVHARGKPYELEVWVQDYKGEVHILKFGSVNYVGWQPLIVDIPTYIPQATETYPQTRSSKIVRFVFRINPSSTREEQMEETFFAFDQLKVLTDTFEVQFDGNELHQKLDGGSPSGNAQPGQ